MLSQEQTNSIVLRLLRPVVRLCLTRLDFPIQQFIEMVRRCYVDLAEEEIKKSGQKVTVSRLSVMTGLNRTTLTKVYRGEEPVLDSSASLIKRVIERWMHDPSFCTKAGKPRVLTHKGDGNEFEKLVAAVSKDTGHKAVLFELLRKEYVGESSKGITLLKTVRGHLGDPMIAMDLLAREVDTLVTAIDSNMFEEHEVKNHQIRTEYDKIAPSKLPEIQEWMLKTGREFHRRARMYLSQFDKDIAADMVDEPGEARVVLSSFGLTTEDSEGVKPSRS